MTTKRDMKLVTTEMVPNCTIDTVKAAFCTWLSIKRGKQLDPSAVVSSLDLASEQLLKRKIASVPIWAVIKPPTFVAIYSNARDNKLFRILDKKNYSAFMQNGQLYLKFLKSKPHFELANEVIETTPTIEPQPKTGLTIKEAVRNVLSETQDSMTADEIYDEIIKRSLYNFGAQNPINVVRNIIESSCDNSTYSEKYQASIPWFHFERNIDGKKVYSLLKAQRVENGETESVPTKVLSKPIERITAIWNDRIEQKFQKWLVQKNYAQKTADNYRRSVAQVFRTYQLLAQEAVMASKTKSEVISRYIDLLNEDSDFIKANATRHNQFTAALAAFERFYSVGIEIVDHEGNEQMPNPPVMISAPTPSLGNIVDLEEGKAGIREILEAHFQTLYGYSNINILWNAAQDTLSLFLNDNGINSVDELWRFIYRAFLGEYVMSNPHIWKTQPNYPQSYVGVIINLAKQLGGTVTRERIDEYFASIKQAPPINATIIRQGSLVFYAPKHFIVSEAINLTNERCSAIAKSLTMLFAREKVSYIVLRDITADWFSTLPEIKDGINWTPLLLQEVLRLKPNIGYRVIFSGLDGQALDTLGAAVVQTQSGIHSFADVAHRYCYEQGLLGKRMTAEDLRLILREAGMLEGNELIYNLHKALRDYRFAFTDENRMVKILER